MSTVVTSRHSVPFSISKLDLTGFCTTNTQSVFTIFVSISLPLNNEVPISPSQNILLFSDLWPMCCYTYVNYDDFMCKFYQFYQLKYTTRKLVLIFKKKIYRPVSPYLQFSWFGKTFSSSSQVDVTGLTTSATRPCASAGTVSVNATMSNRWGGRGLLGGRQEPLLRPGYSTGKGSVTEFTIPRVIMN